jgi:hypothetical protein
MSLHPHQPDFFAATQQQGELPLAQPLPATEKQISYARVLAAKTKTPLPKGITKNRAALSQWIDAHKAPQTDSKFANYPSSKQVQFAERIARLKRRDVPPECFRDKSLMSRWIDANKPH